MKNRVVASIDHEVLGIPCTIEVYSYGYDKPAKLTGHPDTWHPEEGEPAEYSLLDEDGNELDIEITSDMDDAIQEIITVDSIPDDY